MLKPSVWSLSSWVQANRGYEKSAGQEQQLWKVKSAETIHCLRTPRQKENMSPPWNTPILNNNNQVSSSVVQWSRTHILFSIHCYFWIASNQRKKWKYVFSHFPGRPPTSFWGGNSTMWVPQLERPDFPLWVQGPFEFKAMWNKIF